MMNEAIGIKNQGTIDILAISITNRTDKGEILNMKYNPLPLGTPFWELYNQKGKLIMNALNQQRLLDAAEKSGVSVVEENQDE